MTEQDNAIDFVQSSNKARMHEEKKKKEIPSPTIDELKVSHHNHLVDSATGILKEQLERIKKGLGD
tara:strand:+ start:493 stop:690 length:198 start_codon:yes stop_codon:yes gene_type:complete